MANNDIHIYIAIYIHRLSHLMKTINILYNFYSFYCYIIIPPIVYQFQFPFTLSHYWFTVLDIISSYLLCSNTQHEVTVTHFGRQYTIYFYQILEALGQAITDAAFCFDSAAQ